MASVSAFPSLYDQFPPLWTQRPLINQCNLFLHTETPETLSFLDFHIIFYCLSPNFPDAAVSSVFSTLLLFFFHSASFIALFIVLLILQQQKQERFQAWDFVFSNMLPLKTNSDSMIFFFPKIIRVRVRMCNMNKLDFSTTLDDKSYI